MVNRAVLYSVFCLLLPEVLLAHHPTSAFGLSAAAPQSMVELEARWAEYPDSLDGRGGTWMSSALRVEYAFTERFSVAANAPIARVNPNGADGRTGLGDMEFSVKWSLFRPLFDYGHLSIGSGVEVPTGQTDNNIGSGHFELSPFITYQTESIGHVVGYARLNYMVAFGGDGHHHDHHDHHDHGHEGDPSHVSVLAPHADHEIRSLVGAAWVEDSFYVSTSVDHALPLESHDPKTGFFGASFEVGVTALTDWRVALAWDQPISTPRRVDGSLRLGIAYWFGDDD